MTNRIPSQDPTAPTHSPAFGLVAWLEQTKVCLPLKGVECRFHVCGDLVNVEVDQLFHQNSTQAMDCLYTFPLPAGAAVYRCEMHVNGRCIRAKVEEQGRARELAREQHAAGRRTALVEVERDNLFSLSLGNVQPGDLIVIRLAYFQTVTRLADWTSVRIPFCPGVRYIPGQPLLRPLRGRGTVDDTDQVPDASRITPPRIDALHPDAAYLVIEGEFENVGGTIRELSSPSHPLLVRDGDQHLHLKLADQMAVPDGDVVLRWTETPAEDVRTAGWIAKEEEGSAAFALVRLQAPRVSAPVEDGGQDFYFLVDRSGSMQGLKWKKAMAAFRRFLDLLGARDRAWLTLFNNAHADYAERPCTVAEWKADSALARLENLGADGGTELLPALRHVLEAQAMHSTDRRVALVLITDGEVGNEAAILDVLRPHVGLCVHAFGIDTTVNDALLTRVAEQQQGSCCLLTPTDDIVGAVMRLATRLRRPVLTDIAVDGDWEFPADSPAGVHSEEVVLLPLKGRAGVSEVTVRARGVDGAERIFRVPLVPRPEPALRLLWAKRHIDHCVLRGMKMKAIALAARYNVLCEGAAFIAWDESEQVPVALREVYQPSLRPRMLAEYSGITSGRLEEFQYCCMKLEKAAEQPPTAAAPAAAPPGLMRRIVRKAMAPQWRVERKLKAILPKLSPESQAAMLKQGLSRVSRWYVRMTELIALRDLAVDELLLLLFRWAGEKGTEVDGRLEKLNGLLRSLEQSAQGLESGLDLAHAWAEREMAAAPGLLKSVVAWLDRGKAQTRSGLSIRR